MSGIDTLYSDRKALGQEAQRNTRVVAEDVASGFARTVRETDEAVRGGGPFHPEGRKSLRALLERFDPSSAARLGSTHDLAVSLWAPMRWEVENRPELSFFYVSREVTPGSVDIGGGRRDQQTVKISSDLLLVNANVDDNTPIIGEVKLRGDQNALLALLQALASAAQLAPERQRKRLQSVYPDLLGGAVPERLDVYVITHEPPPKGVRPELYKHAVELADELTTSNGISSWVRRIAFLEADYESPALSFREQHLFVN